MMAKSLLWALIALALAPQSVPQAGQTQKLSVPDEETLKTAEKKVREAFKQELAKKGAPERTALANKFIQQAAQTADDAAVRYVLLSEARGLAAQAGDLTTALRAIDEQGRLYDIVTSALKADAIGEVGQAARTPEAFRQLALRSIDVADEAAAADQYDAAVSLVTKAEVLARNTKDAALLTRLGEQARDLKELKKEADAVKSHIKTLSAMPDDPAANLAVGRFYCTMKRDWTRGLPLLVKGSDSSLQEIAQWESINPTKTENQVALADAWWEQAAKAKGLLKIRYQERAAQWYQVVLPDLTGLSLNTVKGRIETYEKVAGRAKTFALFARTLRLLSPEEQFKGVVAQLVALNPGYAPKDNLMKAEGGVITEVVLRGNLGNVKDIGPVGALAGLRVFAVDTQFNGSTFQDLSSLKGLALTSLNISWTSVTDLSPLSGMPLRSLSCGACGVSDLSPLRGMPLDYLDLTQTRVSDLSPLKGMILSSLVLYLDQPVDLSPLTGVSLKSLAYKVNSQKEGQILRAIKSLETINGVPVAEFWKKYEASPPPK